MSDDEDLSEFLDLEEAKVESGTTSEQFEESQDSGWLPLLGEQDTESMASGDVTLLLSKIMKIQNNIDRKFLTYEMCDFLADFGRSETFLLDGDALILYCFENPFLDWRCEGQFLHLTYLFENFLANLCSRGAKFELFFFLNNDELFAKRGASYALGRKVLMHHSRLLGQNKIGMNALNVHFLRESWLTASRDSIASDFESWKSLLEDVRPVFIMTNNICRDSELSIAQHLFVHDQLASRHYVVILDNLEFQGSRIWGFLFNTPQHKIVQNISSTYRGTWSAFAKIFGEFRVSPQPNKSGVPRSQICGKISLEASENLRSALSTEALKHLAHARSDPKWKGLAVVVCFKLAVMENLSLQDRSLILSPDRDKDIYQQLNVSATLEMDIKKFVKAFQMTMTKLIDEVLSVEQPLVIDGSLVDVFDGKLFFALLCYCVDHGTLPDAFAVRYRQLCSIVFPGDEIDLSSVSTFLGVTDEDIRGISEMTRSAAESKQKGMLLVGPRQTLRPLDERETLLSAVLGDVKSKMQWLEADTSPSDFALGKYIPHHYHNTRPLENEPDSFTYELDFRRRMFAHPHSGQWSARAMQMRAWRMQQKKLKQRQCMARAGARLQVSLLLGQPVEPQTIAEKLPQAEFTARKELAFRALGIADTPTVEQLSKQKQKAPSKVAKKTKAQQIIEENLKRMNLDIVTKARARFENLKVTLAKETAHAYLSQMDVFSSELRKQGLSEVALEVKLHCLKRMTTTSDKDSRTKSCFLLAQSILRCHSSDLDDDQKATLSRIVSAEGFCDLAEHIAGDQTKSGAKNKGQHSRQISAIRFQLECAPEHLSRPAGIEKDPRVSFPPDEWQKRLLDVVDSGNSALVVAPTASGKTFISYYVMEQCLRRDDESVVVYVAPTKALVNQVRAEIDARFSKKYAGAQSVASTFTRDFRDENMLNSQILVTVPQCLGIILLSGANVNWTSRIRHVIFDEVHCLGGPAGEAWEQLILLIECPFLALSATLGDVGHFHTWLDTVEKSRGRQVYLVEHYERYNDIFHWVWSSTPSKTESGAVSVRCLVPLNPFWAVHPIGTSQHLSLERFPKEVRMLPEHCVRLYEVMGDKASKSVNPEVFFRQLRADCLWNISMQDTRKWETALKAEFCGLSAEAQHAIVDNLAGDTERCFVQEETRMLQQGKGFYQIKNATPLLQHLKENDLLPAICFMLSRSGCEELAQTVARDLAQQEKESRLERSGWLQKRQRLEMELEEAQKNYEKHRNDTIVILSSEEEDDTAESCYQYYRAVRDKLREHLRPEYAFSLARWNEDDIADAFSSSSKQSQERHWTNIVPPELVQPLRRGIGVHHAGMPKEYRQGIERLFRAKKLGAVFATATLALGINMPAKTSCFIGDAVYLNAMNFRQMSGRAGRRGFDLRGHVIFLGTPSTKCRRLLRSDLPQLQGNMLFSNSLALRLLMRQSALKHLRPSNEERLRGAMHACARLINMPLFNPLAAHAQARSMEGQKLISRQMAHCFRFSVEYLLRCGLLRRDDDGELEPNDLAGFVAHLFHTEPANFAFLTLLTADGGRLLQRLCAPCPDREIKVLTVLCHLFGRRPLPRSVAASARDDPASTGPSIVLLPHLRDIGENVRQSTRHETNTSISAAEGRKKSAVGKKYQTVREGQLVEEALHSHNREALTALVDYCACFVATYRAELGLDNRLPFSDLCCGGFLSKSEASDVQADNTGVEAVKNGPVTEVGPQVQLRSDSLPLKAMGPVGEFLEKIGNGEGTGVRSSFVALSGHGEIFRSVDELCTTARSGLYMDPKMVPIFDLHGTLGTVPSGDETTVGQDDASGYCWDGRYRGGALNSYLLDFFKHGQVEALSVYNGIKRDDIWDDLRDFALVLKALRAAMLRRSSRDAAPRGSEEGTNAAKGRHARDEGTLFDHPDVLDTFEAICDGFAAKLRDAAA